jgi:flagellar protein FlaJ
MDPTVSDQYAQYFLPLAEHAKKLVPSIEEDLKGARMDVNPESYIAGCIARAVQVTLAVGASLIAAGLIMGNSLMWQIGAVGTPVLGFLIFLTFSYQPKVTANKKSRMVEKELPYALRHMLIEVSSGISLYESMVSVSSDYGEASKEFNRIVNDIQGGKSQVEALEDSITRNPSIMYRRAVWQMINALKSGADITKTLDSLVDTMIEEQKLQVQNYGEDLNPFILMYLMLAVIFPSLGATLMIVISSFTGFSLSNNMFLGMLGGLAVFQIFFLNLVKSKRPEVKAA